MADQNQELIKLWLETNLAQASKEGGDALQELRETVKAMGPEVAEAFDKMAGAEVKVAEEQTKLVQGTLDLTERFELQGGTTKVVAQEETRLAEATVQVAQEQGRLVQGMLALEERFELQAETCRISTFETKELAKAEQLLEINTKAVGRGFFELERAGVALATGHGLTRLGPLLERIVGGMGGAAGLGFGLAGVAYAAELVVPKLTNFFNSLDNEKAKEAAEHLDELIKKVQKLQNLKDNEAGEAFASYLPGNDIAGMAAGAIGASGLSAQATPAEMEATKPVYQMTQGGPVLINDPDKAKKAMADRITAANSKMAMEAVANAVEPGAKGRRARDFLKSLAVQNPGAFPPGFAEFIASAEETPEEREKAEADIEANDPDQQYMERHHASMAQHNAEADEFNKNLAAEKHKKDAARKKAREDNAYDKGVAELTGDDPASVKHAQAEVKHLASERYAFERKQESDAKREQARAAREQTKAQHEAAKKAKEDTPEAQYQHQRHEADNQIMGYAQNLNQQNVAQGGRPATPEFMHHVARGAAEQVTMGADIATAVHIAIAQVQAKVAEDFRKGMMRQHQTSQSYYAP